MTSIDQNSDNISLWSVGDSQQLQPVKFPPAVPSEGPANIDQNVRASIADLQASAQDANGIFVTAWALVLTKWMNATSFCFPVSSDNDQSLRTHSMLTFRYDVARDRTLSDIVKEVRVVLESASSPREVNGVDVTDDFQDRSPIQKPRNILLLPSKGTEGGEHSSSGGPEGCSLIVDLRSTASSGEVVIHFDSKVFSQRLANHLIQHFSKLIGVITDKPDTKASHIDCATEADLAQSSEWILPAAPPVEDSMLYSGFEKQLQESPRSIAIRQTEMVMTYKELNALSSTLAVVLSGIPGVKGGPVGIVFEKSAYAIVSILAIWKAGGAYVPLDPAAPTIRIKSIISDAEIKVVLTSAENHSNLQKLNPACPVICVEPKYLRRTKKAQAASQTAATPQEQNKENTDLAVIIYTSGSTGTPKGVALTHRALTTSIEAWSGVFPVDQNTRTFQYAAFTFDISIADIWMTLGQGGCVCLPTEDERLDIVNFVQEQQCTYSCLTTSVVAHIPVDLVSNGPFKALNLCGEPVTGAVVKKFSGNGFDFTSCYGPSEASVYTMRTGRFEPDSNALDIGYPLGASVAIVDPDDPHRLAPVGCIGELAIFGHTLANGYYKNPQKTQEAFRTDLKWAKQLAGTHEHLDRVYLTNDLVRYTGHGSMIYVGRKGGYIKFNGQRIETGEIESNILSQIDGRDIAVHVSVYEAVTDDSVSQHLACFFTNSADQSKAVQPHLSEHDDVSLRMVDSWTAALRERLPVYMIPSLFVPVTTTPKNASGKTEVKRLVGMLSKLSAGDVLQRYGVAGKKTPS